MLCARAQQEMKFMCTHSQDAKQSDMVKGPTCRLQVVHPCSSCRGRASTSPPARLSATSARGRLCLSASGCTSRKADKERRGGGCRRRPHTTTATTWPRPANMSCSARAAMISLGSAGATGARPRRGQQQHRPWQPISTSAHQPPSSARES